MRHKSPLKPRNYEPTGIDERDQIIGKLKEDLIVGRGKQKQVAILQNHVMDMLQRCKILQTANTRTDQELKSKTESSNRAISDLKRELQNLKKQLRATHQELSQNEEYYDSLRKKLDSQNVDIEKYKKQGYHVHEDNEKLMQENYKNKVHEQNLLQEIRRVLQTQKDLQNRVNMITNKIMQVKSYIGELKNEQSVLTNKLKDYEYKNEEIESNIDQKQGNIEELQIVFAQKHEQIKNQVEHYIELQHSNEKTLQQARHKNNLHRSEMQKTNQLTAIIRNVEKVAKETDTKKHSVDAEINEINKECDEYEVINKKLKSDLSSCQKHLQNIMSQNSSIHAELQKYIREDEAIINVIRNKRVMPAVQTYRSIKESRVQGRPKHYF